MYRILLYFKICFRIMKPDNILALFSYRFYFSAVHEWTTCTLLPLRANMIISLSQRSEGENGPEIVVTQQVDVQSDPRLQHRLKQGRSGFSSEWAAGENASGPWGGLTPHEIQQGGNPSLRPGCSRLHLKEICLSTESTTRSRVRLTRSLTCYLS